MVPKVLVWVSGLILCFLVGVSSRLGISSFGLSVSTKSKARVRSSATTVPSLYDQYGSIPQVRSTYKALSRSRQIVVMRGSNFTLAAYAMESSSSPFSDLIISSGIQPFYYLSDLDGPGIKHAILLTGVVGDCRSVVRFAKQLVLNYTTEFAATPTGWYVAKHIGEYLESSMTGGSRLLASHCFVVSSGSAMVQLNEAGLNGTNSSYLTSAGTGTIYEVTAVGGVARIAAGIAGGPNSSKGRSMLQREYRAGMDRNSTTELARRVLEAAHLAQQEGEQQEASEAAAEDARQQRPPFRLSYVILPDRGES